MNECKRLFDDMRKVNGIYRLIVISCIILPHSFSDFCSLSFVYMRTLLSCLVAHFCLN